ncbi:sodium:proton exchanger [Vibrio sp. 10N.286.49.B3]|uniref:potassium/proton antiporter n=1 Tax=Vibrio sp. 10N.286.49.B3 TaxID=1880855 RepID=UPI000C81EA95|nr:potassium/proton antiporter [Vibrio sp. 10N.286.49.B3]PMH44558.1 sodium:proton exchanger [Vibrio sp. 10N.286.49.B3]
MSTELLMLGMAALIAVGILLHQPSKTLGLPSILIFIGVGLLFGNGEFNFVYDDLALTSFIGSLALNVIVFVGGLNTSKASIKVAYKEGGVLSSFGVLFTTLIFGGLLYFITDFNILTCLLFAAVVSSTDAAAVFSILESKKLKLKESTDTILEFESATNDPVALLLVAILTEMLINSHQQISSMNIAVELAQQVIVGLGAGYVIGWCCVKLLNKIKLQEYGLIPVFILACFFIAAYGSDFLGGNILVSSYVAGVLIGNELRRGREVSKHFFNSLSWLAQSLMFIILGLQFFPKELFGDMWSAVIPAMALIFIARPVAVFLSYLPFRKVSFKKKLFVSAIGLKGATPIVFALIPASAGVPGSQEMIHMVFFIVLISVILQGWAIEPLSEKLGLVDK